MKEKADNCIVCSETSIRSVVVQLGSASILGCNTCGSWLYRPRSDASEQFLLHDSSRYFNHPYFWPRRKAGFVLENRCKKTFDRISRAIELDTLRGERLLDVGCDTGSFLLEASKQFGVVPVGLDISLRAVEEVLSSGIEAYHASLDTAPTHLRNFIVITAIDVLEHVYDPINFLAQINSMLKPGGVVYIETPNPGSVVYQLGAFLCNLTNGQPSKIFERLFPQEHAHYFTYNALNTLAHRCGLEVLSYETRVLSYWDISTSFPIRFSLAVLQLIDILRQNMILHCILLKRPIR